MEEMEFSISITDGKKDWVVSPQFLWDNNCDFLTFLAGFLAENPAFGLRWSQPDGEEVFYEIEAKTTLLVVRIISDGESRTIEKIIEDIHAGLDSKKDSYLLGMKEAEKFKKEGHLPEWLQEIPETYVPGPPVFLN